MEYLQSSGRKRVEMSSVRHQVLTRQWQQQVLDQQSSGLSVRRWCAEQNIRECKYYYWLHVLRSEELTVRQPASVFAQLQVATTGETTLSSATSGICVVIRSRELCLEIHNGADPQTLAGVMHALGVQYK